MKEEFNDIDKLFKDAFERVTVSLPDEDLAWKKMQQKMYRRRTKMLVYATHAAVFAGTLIIFLGFNDFKATLPADDTHYIQRLSTPNQTSTDNHHLNSDNHSLLSGTSAAQYTHSTTKHTRGTTTQYLLHTDSSKEESPISIQPYRPIDAESLSSHKYASSNEIEEIHALTIPKKKSINWALSTGIFLHNHLVSDGHFMGSNIPSIGLVITKSIRPNLELLSGIRYVHRGNMDYRTFSKTREVYNQEEINIYTLYVKGTHWIEIPLGFQYSFPEKKVHIGTSITTDILVFQSAQLGVKTEVPALQIESEERRKRAWNYDSGIPLINLGLRSEIGTYITAKNALNLFVKVSPYSGELNANITKDYGFDVGIEWRYYF